MSADGYELHTSDLDEPDLTLEEVQAERMKGAELAWLSQAVEGAPKRYCLIGYEVYPNGTTSDPIEAREEANTIGERFGLGHTTDPAGFAIWTEDRPLAWQRLRDWLFMMKRSAPWPGLRDFYEGILVMMERIQRDEPHIPLRIEEGPEDDGEEQPAEGDGSRSEGDGPPNPV